jgi:hypothetical protein
MDLRSLVLNFFKGMNCQIQEGNIIIIGNVPKDFEELYGRSSPYKFTFDSEQLQPEVELIIPSCNLIKTINDYLKNKANTTVLKLSPKVDLTEDLSKYLIFNNYEVLSLSKQEKFDYVFRFTFETQFQYLNEIEKIVTKVYVHEDGAIDNFQIEDYETVSGEKEDLAIKDIKNQAVTAKEKVRESLQEKINNLGEKLKESLRIETKRIEKHYSELLKETLHEIKKNNLKIQELINFKPENYQSKIQRLEGILEKLEEKANQDKLNKEISFQIKNEKQKHSLGISTRLLNRVVIYYSIYNLNIHFKDKNTEGRTTFEFNSLTKQIQGLNCSYCKEKLIKINFCSSGHLTCDSCLLQCGFCMSELCNACNQDECGVCKRNVCKNCKNVCEKCKKQICNDHIRNDFLKGGNICSSCSSICSKCNKSTDKKFFREINNKPVCPTCFGKKLNPLEDDNWGI